jgi:hypothetical protein
VKGELQEFPDRDHQIFLANSAECAVWGGGLYLHVLDSSLKQFIQSRLRYMYLDLV